MYILPYQILLFFFFYRINNLLNQESLSLYLIALDEIEMRHLASEISCKLTAIQFTDYDLSEMREDLFSILRQRTDVIEMSHTYFFPFCPHFFNCGEYMSVCSAPAYHKDRSEEHTSELQSPDHLV